MISNDISLLYQLLNIIQKASKKSHNLDAARSFRLEDDENNDLEPKIQEHFAQSLRGQFPEMNETILQRLVSTMILRRKKIMYRRSQCNNPWQIRKKTFVDTKSARISGKLQPVEQGVTPSATILATDKFKMVSPRSGILDSDTTALTSQQDLVFPPAPIGQIRRQLREKQNHGHTTSTLNALWKTKSPFSQAGSTFYREATPQELSRRLQQSKEAEIAEISCPFCLQALLSKDVLEPKKWQ